MSIELCEKRFLEYVEDGHNIRKYISKYTFNKVKELHDNIKKVFDAVEFGVSLKFGFIKDHDNIMLEYYYDQWSFYNAINKCLEKWHDIHKNLDIKWIISISEYIESGYSGGNCWGGESTMFIEHNGKFEEYDPRRLFEYLKDYAHIGDYTVYEYYGNCSNYKAQYYFLQDFINAIDNYQQIIHVFIGLPGSGKTFFATQKMEQLGNEKCVLLDDVSRNLILLTHKYSQKHIMVTDPLLVEVSRDQIIKCFKHFYHDAEIKLYWCTSELNYCINNCKIRDNNRIISDVYLGYLNSKYNYKSKIREDLGDELLQTIQSFEEKITDTNIWLRII